MTNLKLVKYNHFQLVICITNFKLVKYITNLKLVKSATNYKLVKFVTKLEIGQIRNQLLIGQLYEFSNELYMSLCHNRQKHIYKLFMIFS